MDLVQTAGNELRQRVTLAIEDIKKQTKASLDSQVGMTVDISARLTVLEQTVGELTDSVSVHDVLGEPVSFTKENCSNRSTGE